MRYVIAVIAVVLMVYLVIEFNSRTAELNRLRIEREAVSVHLMSQQETKAALEVKIAYATSEAAADRWGHENHLAMPVDIVVIPMQVGDATPTPRPKPVVQATEVSNLESWLSLFFDPKMEAVSP